MNVQLNYEEVLSFVESQYHIRPTVRAVDDATLSVTYKVNTIVPVVLMALRVDEVSKETVTFSYNCSNIVTGLLKGFIFLIEKKIPKHEIEISTDDKKIHIHLNAFKQLEKVLEYVAPTEIVFKEDSVNIGLRMIERGE